MPRLLRILFGLVALGALGVIGALASVYHWANGITPGSVAFSSLAFVCAFALISLGQSALRRPARVLIAIILTVDAAWAAARLTRPPGTALKVCEAGVCDGRGRFWQRVPDERETARFGLYLSKLAGTMRGAEARHFDTLLDERYGSLPESWRGLPNALLLQRGQRLEHVPSGSTPGRPCLVFLHGFGGELSLYLRAIVESKLGAEYVVVAPVLDNFGIWWSQRGVDTVVTTLDTLPPEVDRSRVVLVGLSNGGIGASALLAEPRVRRGIAAAVLVSGAGNVGTGAQLGGVPVLAISGTKDPRMPIDYIEDQVSRLEAAGAKTELTKLDADHFLILTHAKEWTEEVYVMGTTLGRGSSEGSGSP